MCVGQKEEQNKSKDLDNDSFCAGDWIIFLIQTVTRVDEDLRNTFRNAFLKPLDLEKVAMY